MKLVFSEGMGLECQNFKERFDEHAVQVEDNYKM